MNAQGMLNQQAEDIMSDQGTTELQTIQSPLDRRRVGDMTIEKFGGLTFVEYREAVEFAKVMCQSRHSIPAYLKQNVGDCLAVITQSLRWRLEPFWLAQHSYVAKPNDQNSLIAYDAAVHAAIVISMGNLKGRPRYTFEGEGEDRRCTVSATFVGETEPHEYTTPPLSACRPKRNADGVIKGSPLWDKDPDQQQGYYAVRNWGRRHCPEVLGGVYDRDEFEASQDGPTGILGPTASPNLMERLPGRMAGEGFTPDAVANGLAETPRKAPRKRRAKGGDETLADHDPITGEVAPERAGPSDKGLIGPALQADAQWRKWKEQKDAAAAQKAGESAKAQDVPLPDSQASDRRPESAGEYIVYAEWWISQVGNVAIAERRWDDEAEMRDRLSVPVKDRNELRATLDHVAERVTRMKQENKP
jgi:hypothetical protein